MPAFAEIKVVGLLETSAQRPALHATLAALASSLSTTPKDDYHLLLQSPPPLKRLKLRTDLQHADASSTSCPKSWLAILDAGRPWPPPPQSPLAVRPVYITTLSSYHDADIVSYFSAMDMRIVSESIRHDVTSYSIDTNACNVIATTYCPRERHPPLPPSAMSTTTTTMTTTLPPLPDIKSCQPLSDAPELLMLELVTYCDEVDRIEAMRSMDSLLESFTPLVSNWVVK